MISLLAVTVGGLGFALQEPEKARTIEATVLVPAKSVVRELKEAESQVTHAAREWKAEPKKDPPKIRIKHADKPASKSARLAKKSSKAR